MNRVHATTVATVVSWMCSLGIAVDAQEYNPETVMRRTIRAITGPPITSADKADITN